MNQALLLLFSDFHSEENGIYFASVIETGSLVATLSFPTQKSFKILTIDSCFLCFHHFLTDILIAIL